MTAPVCVGVTKVQRQLQAKNWNTWIEKVQRRCIIYVIFSDEKQLCIQIKQGEKKKEKEENTLKKENKKFLQKREKKKYKKFGCTVGFVKGRKLRGERVVNPTSTYTTLRPHVFRFLSYLINNPFIYSSIYLLLFSLPIFIYPLMFQISTLLLCLMGLI